MEEHDLFQIAVKALVYDKEGKFLLMKADDGEWDLPGGRMHYNESFEQALQRECMEELGVKCKLLRRQPNFVWTGENSKGSWRADVCFKAELENLNFTSSNENVEHGFFTVEEARKLNLSPHLNQLKEIL